MIKEQGNIPYVTRTDVTNGIDMFICEQSTKYKVDEGNVITIGLDTQTVFYQPSSFYTGQNIQVIRHKELDRYNAQFLIVAIKKLVDKFSWGSYGATLTRLRKSKIYLPVDSNGNIDFPFMSSFMKQIETDILGVTLATFKNKLKGNRLNISKLGGVNWGRFFIEDITEIVSGQDIYERERTEGLIPYITATSNHNGIGYFVGNTNATLESECLSVNRNGSVGYCFYHPYKALYGNDTRKLRPKLKNKYVSLFISMCITSQREKYGYGYKMGTGRLKRQCILLPIDNVGQPDWEFMEQYMRYIENAKVLKFLSSINNRML